METKSRTRRPKVVRDVTYSGMYRVQWPDGRFSDIANLTRANDAIAAFEETLERRKRGRQRPLEAHPCVKTTPGMAA